MIINWYPGHMAKAKRLIQENLKIIDVVIELVDARIPMSSTNPMIKSLIGDKPSVVVLNKADLADPAVLDEWVAYYKQQGRKVLALNSKGGKGVKQLISLVRSLAAPKLARWKARGLKNRAFLMSANRRSSTSCPAAVRPRRPTSLAKRRASSGSTSATSSTSWIRRASCGRNWKTRSALTAWQRQGPFPIQSSTWKRSSCSSSNSYRTSTLMN